MQVKLRASTRSIGGWAADSLVTLLAVVLVLAATARSATAATWCVNPGGQTGCVKTIGAAVSGASPGDSIYVAPGTYAESVVIGMPLALIGADPSKTTIDATGLPNGIWVDGIDHAGLSGVVISGLTVQNANFEGILVTNASNVTVSENTVTGNNKGLAITSTATTCPGLPVWETNEAEDCGEGIHLMGVDHSAVLNNTVQNNAGGILISDDTGATHDNLVSGNLVANNASDCGITLASHVPAAISGSATALGVYHIMVSNNQSMQNGGAGVGIFASAPGTKSYGNVATNNTLTGNGLPGVAMHGHTPNQNLNDNVIVGNRISGNAADTADAATPGPTGINVFSVTPVTGLVISRNVVDQELVGVAVKLPGEVLVFRNSLAGNTIGVANLGSGTVTANSNWWGCSGGPIGLVASFAGCSYTSGAVNVASWLPGTFVSK